MTAWAPDWQWLATAGWHGPVCLWHGEDGTLLHRWDGHWAAEPALAVGRGGQALAFSRDAGQVQVWMLPSGALLQELRGLPGALRCLGFTSWGHLLAVGDTTGAVAVSTDLGAQIASGPPVPVHSLAFTPSTWSLIAVAEDGTITTWAVQDGPTLGLIRVWAPPEQGWYLRQVVFAPDRRMVAVVTGADAVWLWRDAAPRLEASGPGGR